LITANPNSEQTVREKIDTMLLASGWRVQSENQGLFTTGVGVSVREYQIDIGPADYILFVIKNQSGLLKQSEKKELFGLLCMKTNLLIM
jgi:type I restriction enzyme R subunit